MTNDISKTRSRVRVELKHIGNQVLELFREESRRFVVLMLFPEEVSSVSDKQLVVWVLHVSLVEWGMSSKQDEQNDAKCEQVDHVALVVLLLNQFWGHVCRSSKNGF